MVLVVSQARAELRKLPKLSPIILKLNDDGYKPLIAGARQAFLATANPTLSLKSVLDALDSRNSNDRASRLFDAEDRRYVGDLFRCDDSTSLYFLRAIPGESRPVVDSKGGMRIERTQASLRVGFIGMPGDAARVEVLKKTLGETGELKGESLSWTVFRPENQVFEGVKTLAKGSYFPADQLTGVERKAASLLNDRATKGYALSLRTSGGLLEKDLNQGVDPAEQRDTRLTNRLIDAGLCEREFVVICRKTSRQVNRARDRESLDRAVASGVRCSCGQPLTEEIVEVLLSPTPLTQRMLDKSHWMSVIVVEELAKAGIPPDRVLLNVVEGSNETDMMIDLDGALAVAELKDDEFSLGHAFPLGGRIAMYHPDFTMILSSKHVSREVAEYFQKTGPDTEILYANGIEEIHSAIDRMVHAARSSQANSLLESFNRMPQVSDPFFGELKKQLALSSVSPRRRQPPRW